MVGLGDQRDKISLDKNHRAELGKSNLCRRE